MEAVIIVNQFISHLNHLPWTCRKKKVHDHLSPFCTYCAKKKKIYIYDATKSDVGQPLCEFKYRCADRNHIGGRNLTMETYIINYTSKLVNNHKPFLIFLPWFMKSPRRMGKSTGSMLSTSWMIKTFPNLKDTYVCQKINKLVS